MEFCNISKQCLNHYFCSTEKPALDDFYLLSSLEIGPNLLLVLFDFPSPLPTKTSVLAGASILLKTPVFSLDVCKGHCKFLSAFMSTY